MILPWFFMLCANELKHTHVRSSYTREQQTANHMFLKDAEDKIWNKQFINANANALFGLMLFYLILYIYILYITITMVNCYVNEYVKHEKS